MRGLVPVGLGTLGLYVGVGVFCDAVVGTTLVVLTALLGTVAYVLVDRRLTRSAPRFLGKFAVVCLGFLALEVSLLIFFPGLHGALRDATAQIVARLLNWGGADYHVSGAIIWLENDPIATDVSVACLGGVLFWVYFALVLAPSDPTPWQRLIGLALGVGAILLFNVLRITLSIHLQHANGLDVHDYFYLVNMVFVLLVWVGWLIVVQRRASHGQGE